MNFHFDSRMTDLNITQCHYSCQAEKEIPGLTQQIVGEILKSGSKLWFRFFFNWFKILMSV